MTKLTWGDAGTRYFQTGLDRGVIYMRGLTNKSVSALTNSIGSKVAVLQDSSKLVFPVGSYVRFDRLNETLIPGVTMTGNVTAINNATPSITVNVTSVTGTVGSNNSWVITRLDTAVPWNGLTAVDENGADSATPHYIDGRPYLFKPNPKEFVASVKAITYPDELNRLQGYAEAVGGMYLDSQQSEDFDLCYRTLLGNDVKSIDFAYKIHCVYKAVITPQSITRATLTNQAAPNEFSWDLQAVPVSIAGYRSTAHVEIDSRKVTSAQLTAVENLLYGTASNYARMPLPQTILTTIASN